VSNVTASVRVSRAIGINVGFGDPTAYAGNLVPFGAGVTYEENPVISYVPLRGEPFLQRMLSPVSPEQVLLLDRMSTPDVPALRLLVRRANGILNPLFAGGAPRAATESFDTFVALFATLRERGDLDVVRDGEGQLAVRIQGAARESPAVEEFLRILDVPGRVQDGDVVVPLRFRVRQGGAEGLDLETPSALEVIDAAGLGVEVPDEHAASGLAERLPRPVPAPMLVIRSSRTRPDAAAVAIAHRGWWFYVDARDARGKQAFAVLRALVGLRMDETSSGRAAPVLTVPVGG
jgi:hypothetical protein